MSELRSRNLKIADFQALVSRSDEGSQQSAAAKLGRNQSSISRSITKLEEAFGHPIYARSEPSRITRRGQATVTLARDILTLCRTHEASQAASTRQGAASTKPVKKTPPNDDSMREAHKDYLERYARWCAHMFYRVPESYRPAFIARYNACAAEYQRLESAA